MIGDSANPIRFDFFDSYDPEKRAGTEEIQASIKAIAAHPAVTAALDAANSEMIVANRDLQIVAANRRVLENLGTFDTDSVVGKRLGELVGCKSREGLDISCGSADECAGCGVTGAVLTSMQTGRIVEGEWTLSTVRDGRSKVLEYGLRATPITLSGREFTVLSLQEVSDTNRRAALERVFIHDLNNTLSALWGWSEVLNSDVCENDKNPATHVYRLVKRLVREVDYHRILTAVESNLFEPRITAVNPIGVLTELKTVIETVATTQKQTVKIHKPVKNPFFKTDPVLLERVLINMVKNAVEAEEPGKEIEIGCTVGDGIRFFVTNPSPIPSEAHTHIFEPSFSTKSQSGRGLGTYSMKLFGETVLGGKVWFEVHPKKGTTFFVELPV